MTFAKVPLRYGYNFAHLSLALLGNSHNIPDIATLTVAGVRLIEDNSIQSVQARSIP
jgi:hypothetical protein